ncbi:MAG: hypothetical protein HKP10_00425, partial [Kiritimatiellales bacterium]|nr:hypothetical protein [Kiritimatiellales bacterium]
MFKRETGAVLASAVALIISLSSCSSTATERSFAGGEPDTLQDVVQKLFGNRTYPAISYSGHRKVRQSIENTPSIEETKEDLKILSAMGFRMLRTYNTQEFPHTERTLMAIRQLKQADPDFEMIVMLGAWIQCRNAFRKGTDHSVEDAAWNQK